MESEIWELGLLDSHTLPNNTKWELRRQVTPVPPTLPPAQPVRPGQPHAAGRTHVSPV